MQAIIVKFLPPTSKQPPRLRAIAAFGATTIKYPTKANFNNAHMYAVRKLLKKCRIPYEGDLVEAVMPNCKDRVFVMDRKEIIRSLFESWKQDRKHAWEYLMDK